MTVPEAFLPPAFPRALSFPSVDCVHYPEDSYIILGSSRPQFLFSLSYMDDYIWQVFIVGQYCPNHFDISRPMQGIVLYILGMLGDLSLATCARGGRAHDVHMHVEIRKEHLEQLPPPLYILDPPFAPRCILSSGSRSRLT